LDERERALKYLDLQIGKNNKLELTEKEIEETKETINSLSIKASANLAKELDLASENIDFNNATLKEKQKILAIVQKIVDEQKEDVKITKESAQAVENERIAKEQAAKARTQASQLDIEFSNTMQYAEQATSIAEKVMTITGGLSSLAMT
jgi:nucleotide-binding universal stress UspA family protein